MPVVHFMRRVRRADTPGDQYDGATSVPICGVNLGSAYGPQRTRDKDRVTCKKCKKCRKKLGLNEPETLKSPKARVRPTAWDHLDALEDQESAPEAVETPVPLPVPVVATPVLLPPTSQRERVLRDRIAIIFFHLMRSHLGVDTVVSIADMASRHVTGPGIDINLEERARALADLILAPERPAV